MNRQNLIAQLEAIEKEIPEHQQQDQDVYWSLAVIRTILSAIHSNCTEDLARHIYPWLLAHGKWLELPENQTQENPIDARL